MIHMKNKTTSMIMSATLLLVAISAAPTANAGPVEDVEDEVRDQCADHAKRPECTFKCEADDRVYLYVDSDKSGKDVSGEASCGDALLRCSNVDSCSDNGKTATASESGACEGRATGGLFPGKAYVQCSASSDDDCTANCGPDYTPWCPIVGGPVEPPCIHPMPPWVCQAFPSLCDPTDLDGFNPFDDLEFFDPVLDRVDGLIEDSGELLERGVIRMSSAHLWMLEDGSAFGFICNSDTGCVEVEPECRFEIQADVPVQICRIGFDQMMM